MSTVMSLASPALAEYRAFELRIEKIDNPDEHRVIISNLDPLQYRGFYVVQHDERVYYTKTWMCHGRTGSFRKICDPPAARDPVTEESTATESAPPAVGEPPTSVEKSLTP